MLPYGLELLLVIFRRYSQADSLVRMRMLKTTRKISQLKTIEIFLYDITYNLKSEASSMIALEFGSSTFTLNGTAQICSTPDQKQYGCK